MPKIIDHDQRRQELIEASWAVMAAEGLEGVTMRKVATAAGCTTGRITHYFADREALILAALKASNQITSDRVRTILEADLDARAKLIGMAEQTLPLDAKRRNEVKVWLAFWSAATLNETLAKENDARMDEWLKALAPLIQEWAPKADAIHEAKRLIALINGLGIQAAVSATRKNLAMVKDVITRHIDQLAH